jgi:hypothetical protein
MLPLLLAAAGLGMAMLSEPRRGSLRMLRALNQEHGHGVLGMQQLELPLQARAQTFSREDLPDGVSSLLQTFEIEHDEPLWALILGDQADAYVVSVKDNMYSAIEEGEQLAENDRECRYLEVLRLDHVPVHVAHRLMTMGTRDQDYSDGYEASGDMSRYAAREPAWTFDYMEDREFSEWTEEQQEDHRANVISSTKKITLPAGTNLYLSTDTPHPFEADDEPEEWGPISVTTDRAYAQRELMDSSYRPGTKRLIVLKVIEDIDGVFKTSEEWETESLEEVMEMDRYDEEEVDEKLEEYTDAPGWFFGGYVTESGKAEPVRLVLRPTNKIEVVKVIPL